MHDNIRILIAEDNEDLRAALCSVVNEEAGMSCVADTAELDEIVSQSLEHAAELVVLDIELAGKSSLRRLPDLRARLPEVKFVVFSGHNNPEMIRGAKSVGAAAYVVKSGDTAELMQTIREVMQNARRAPLA